MYNIWSFLLQTISVSIVAGVLLLLKHLLEDKLSPRWQYSVWILLGIRILIPVNLKSYVIPVISIWMEMLKSGVEAFMHSAYSAVYEPIQLHHIIPIITKLPQSITDWLFVIYVIGILVCMLYYFTSYIRLHVLLKSGLPVGEKLEEKILTVCEKYDLKPCKLIAVEGISTAFICGVIRPVLVVPYAKDMDEKILLHELLHLKYYDTIQNIFWCMMRSLHWCNPLIHLIVNYIENDMETLCDQRVLELLEGEERRDYGAILLEMASEKYARIPGTSSISNGGKNISHRITSIVRFKKYPQGMKLVSICIILILFWPIIIGSEYTFTRNDYEDYDNRFEKEMAIARINRCGTIAGAIDTYTKGLYLMNGGYIASATSFSEHERIQLELEEYGCYQPGKYIGNIDYINDYIVYNLDQRSEDEYVATICLDVTMYIDDSILELFEGTELEKYDSCDAYIFVPVSIKHEDAWVVEENDERWIVAEQNAVAEDTLLFCGKKYYGKNDVGEVKLEIETKYKVNNSVQHAIFSTFSDFDTQPKTNTKFDNYSVNKHVVFTPFSDEAPRSYVELTIKEVDTKDYFKNESNDFSVESHNEDGWTIFEGTLNWDGKVEDYAGGGYGASNVEIYDVSSMYNATLLIGGDKMEDILLVEVTE
ncbi:MAG: M56 family metallopeptidase [Agathobacter sp.]|nr:M56 family metallopeptidase [Agathobacter sp.]